MSVELLHTEDEITCPLILQPALVPGSTWQFNRHLELKCEDCEARRLMFTTLEAVGDMYNYGRVTQACYEAYTFVWAKGAPRFSNLGGSLPDFEDARRIARKMWRLRFPARDLPEGLAERGLPARSTV